MRYIFEFDQRFRVYLRFLFETFAVFAVYSIWLFSINGFKEFDVIIHLVNLLIWLFLYKILGLNKDRLRFSSLTSYIPILYLSLIFSVILTIEHSVYTGKVDIFKFLFVLLALLNSIVGLRVVVRQLIRKDLSRSQDNILVYGTSDIAIDLVNAMVFSKKYRVVGFISDSHQVVGSLAGLPVIHLADVANFAESNNCNLIVLARETENFYNKTNILQKFDKLGLSVSIAPTMDRAFDYEVQLKAVKPEDVLGRSSESQIDEIIYSEINHKTLLVTGAGGSIGSELCRQILRYQPEILIILELNELALYSLEQELSELTRGWDHKTDIIYHLGSVTDKTVLDRLFQKYSIEIIYHAAAYKHVPIVEENIVAGISNNVFGTKTLADFAHRFGVDKFVLVSTDKAIRPTNVMGATKRLSELVIQDFSKFSKTTFTIVRFGNVLGSSGSVIPKFKTQINKGGPITVTHSEITRYFMSIQEAAHLVINAGALASGGEVFLLDMGDPVKIVELAKSMIRQHGLRPVLMAELGGRKPRANEILIIFSGLRPGEKLYEELLVDGVAQATSNPKIFRSEDGSIDYLDLDAALRRLEQYAKENDPLKILEELRRLPISYQSISDVKQLEPRNDEVAEPNLKVDNSEEKEKSDGLLSVNQRSSLLLRLVSSKLGLMFLHRYFLLTRGMTLGVRIFVQNQLGEVLLVKHTYLPDWHLPGGGVDYGEDIFTAAARELYEETNIYDISCFQIASIELNDGISKRDHVIFLTAKTQQKTVRSKSLEISRVGFFDLNCLPKNIDTLSKNVIKKLAKKTKLELNQVSNNEVEFQESSTQK